MRAVAGTRSPSLGGAHGVPDHPADDGVRADGTRTETGNCDSSNAGIRDSFTLDRCDGSITSLHRASCRVLCSKTTLIPITMALPASLAILWTRTVGMWCTSTRMGSAPLPVPPFLTASTSDPITLAGRSPRSTAMLRSPTCGSRVTKRPTMAEPSKGGVQSPAKVDALRRSTSFNAPPRKNFGRF